MSLRRQQQLKGVHLSKSLLFLSTRENWGMVKKVVIFSTAQVDAIGDTQVGDGNEDNVEMERWLMQRKTEK